MYKSLISSASLLLCLLIGSSHASDEQSNHTVTEHAWFDVEIKNYEGPGEDYNGRFVIALFGDTVPMTVMNFAQLTKGYKRGNQNLRYKNSYVHRIVPDFVIQMGDITVGDGTGGRSVYGDTFNDENFILSHEAAGYVSMANHGKDTNGSQFFIILNRARWLDGKHVVFGKVIEGFETVRTIGEVESDATTAIPKKRVKIIDCGLEGIDRKYSLSKEQAQIDGDLKKP